jgi:hypothetical protein
MALYFYLTLPRLKPGVAGKVSLKGKVKHSLKGNGKQGQAIP